MPESGRVETLWMPRLGAGKEALAVLGRRMEPRELFVVGGVGRVGFSECKFQGAIIGRPSEWAESPRNGAREAISLLTTRVPLAEKEAEELREVSLLGRRCSDDATSFIS